MVLACRRAVDRGSVVGGRFAKAVNRGSRLCPPPLDAALHARSRACAFRATPPGEREREPGSGSDGIPLSLSASSCPPMTCPSVHSMSSRQRSSCTVNTGAVTLSRARGKSNPQRRNSTHAVLCVLQAGEDCGDSGEESESGRRELHFHSFGG